MIVSNLNIMKKPEVTLIIGIVLFLLYTIQFPAFGVAPKKTIHKKTATTIKQNQNTKGTEEYTPPTLRADSTAFSLYDNKVIPYKTVIKYCYEEDKGHVIEIYAPFDAIPLYGEKARNGAVVAETIKTETK